MYAFTNRFSGPSLRQRVGMINSQPSGPLAWWRYILWLSVMGIVVLACQHGRMENATIPNQTFAPNALAASTPTRAIVVDLEDKGTCTDIWLYSGLNSGPRS